MATFESQAIKEVRAADPEELMLRYKESGSLELRNQLVMHYLQYVNTAIWGMRTILISNIPYDDFFDQGVLALMECIERYDPDRGASFDTYSYMAIRCAMLKYLRKQNWLSNRLWEMRKKIVRARAALEQQLGRQPAERELAEYLGISEGELGKCAMEIAVIDTISFEELLESAAESRYRQQTHSVEGEVIDKIVRGELQKALAESIDLLEGKQKQVVALYYYENLNLREIGEVLDVSPQRVSQIRKKALEKLMISMKERGFDNLG
ncbi:sigma-70 family RNA polymerase sigma factor [Acidaminobacterium chupaoyuni]